jgi:outer membrane protein OmpA-like peptidoglycan-associated protein
MNHFVSIAALALLVLPEAACASQPKPAQAPQPGQAALPPQAVQAAQPPPPQSPTPVEGSAPPGPGEAPGTVDFADSVPYNMYLEDGIQLFCRGRDQFFTFDASKPSLADEPKMKSLLECLLGPLHGRSIKLIGKTDPRGTQAYNERLGLRRADTVKAFLVANGIAASRIQTVSAGAEDAAKAPKDWPLDRRVQVVLLP